MFLNLFGYFSLLFITIHIISHVYRHILSTPDSLAFFLFWVISNYLVAWGEMESETVDGPGPRSWPYLLLTVELKLFNLIWNIATSFI